LIATSETAEQRAGGRAKEQSLGARKGMAAGRHTPPQGSADRNDRPSTAISAARGAAGRWAAAGQPDDRQPAAVIVTPTHCRVRAKAEDALGEHREEDEPAGEDRFHDRERREGEPRRRAYPGHDRHDPADQEPSGAKPDRRRLAADGGQGSAGPAQRRVVFNRRRGWRPPPKRGRGLVRRSPQGLDAPWFPACR
jgi:hypothetical protein